MDLTVLSFLAPPFVASLVIAGIHVYLGVHVVERGVIFVDLSLAQIAAFGATIALLHAVVGRRPAWERRVLNEPGVHGHWRGHFRDDSRPSSAHPPGSDHRHFLRCRIRSDDSRDQ